MNKLDKMLKEVSRIDKQLSPQSERVCEMWVRRDEFQAASSEWLASQKLPQDSLSGQYSFNLSNALRVIQAAYIEGYRTIETNSGRPRHGWIDRDPKYARTEAHK